MYWVCEMTQFLPLEAGMTQEVADFHKQFLDIITLAKETGEKEHGAAIMAISLISLDLAEESGV